MANKPNNSISGFEPDEEQFSSSGEDIFDTALYPNTKEWSERQIEDCLKKNNPRICSIVKKHIYSIPDYALDMEDLFQEARIAFCRALSTYDPDQNAQFHTYAYKCILNALNEKYRAAKASKRMPALPPISFDSVFWESGKEYMGGDNREIYWSTARQENPVEHLCIRKEAVDRVREILRKHFTPDEEYIFYSLALKWATQKELACEMKCSQANISYKYKRIRDRLFGELRDGGFDEMP